MDLNLLRTFVAACKAGSVSHAARQVGLPKSTVSRHLKKLEDEAGGALLTRSSEGLSMTPEGRRLFELVRGSIYALEQIDGPSRRESDGAGGMTIQVPRVFARGVLGPVMNEYLAMHPDHSIECRNGDRYEEHDLDSCDVIVAVGLRLSAISDEWPLMSVEARLYAAPLLFASTGVPEEPADAERHPFLLTCRTSGVHQRIEMTTSTEKSVSLNPVIRLATDELDHLVPAAIAGLGIARLPDFVGEPLVRTGELVRVLPEHHTDRMAVTLNVAPTNRNPVARSFVDFVVERLSGRARPAPATALPRHRGPPARDLPNDAASDS